MLTNLTIIYFISHTSILKYTYKQSALQCKFCVEITCKLTTLLHKCSSLCRVSKFSQYYYALLRFKFASLLYYKSTDLITRPKVMYGSYLVRVQSFTEQIHRRQLTTEHSILVHLRGTTQKTLVKRLQGKQSPVLL